MTSSALPPYHQLQSNLYQQSQPNSTTTLSPPLPSSSSILMTKTTTERSTATSINQNNHLNYPLHPPPPSHHFQHQPSSSSSSSNSSVSSFVLFNNNSNNNSSSSNNNNSDLLQPPNHHFHLHSHYQSYLNPNQNSPQPNSFTSDSRTQLYVGNLPYRVRWQDLKDLFRKAGTVLRTDVSLTPENRSKGFGTVLFATRSDAQKAVEIYNGFNWQTRTLEVRFDQHDPTGSLAASNSSSVINRNPNQQPLQTSYPHQQYNHYNHNQIHPNQSNALNHYYPSNQYFTPSSYPHPQQHPPPPSYHLPHPPIPSAQHPLPSPINSAHHSAQVSIPSQKNGLTIDSIPPLPPSDTSSPPPSLPTSMMSSRDDSLLPVNKPSVDTSLPNSSSKHIPSLLISSTNHPNSEDESSNSTTSHSLPSMISTLTDDISGLRLRPSTSNPSHTLRSRPLDALQPAFLPVSHSCLPLFKNETNSGNFLLSDPNEDLSNYRPVPSPYLPHPFYPLNPVPHYQQYPQRPYSTGASLSVADSSSFQVNVGMGRHLFVGNLPFNFQWQELKDLFRQAGNIMRADVALGLDGKSRGFGTVLFATAEDAEQARRMYDGYELRGRALKVHVDRFAQASGTFQPLPPTPSQKSFYSPQPPTISSSGLQPPLISPPQAKKKPELAEVSRADAQENDLNEDREKARSELWEGDPVEVTPSGLPAGGISPIASRRPSQFKNVGKSIHDDQGPQSGPQPIGHPHNNNMLKPHSIPMPPPYDLTGDLQSGIMSPPIPKLVQITPSMPAFSFQALPSTPPLLPQFFSPGIGPSISNMREQAAPGEKVDDELQVDSVIEKLDKSATGSGMNYNPMFPIEDEKERMSNVDWGYNSQTGGNRRASFFGGAGAGHGDGEESGSMSQTSSLGFGSRMIGRGSGLQFGMAKHEIFSHAGLGNHYNNRRASFDISSLNPRAIKQANERRNRKFTSDGAAPGTGGRSVDETSTRLRVQIGTELEKQKEEDEDDAWSEDKNHEDKKAQITEIVGLGLAEPVWERTAAANSVQLSR